MIRETSPQKPAYESSLRNSAVSKSQLSSQTAKSSVSASSAAFRSAASLAAAAGLPIDKLSSSIVSFARFFSLPLKPQLLADIRRQALGSPPQPASSQSAASNLVSGESLTSLAKTREALSLAAAAAESKGVELQPKGLESYAEAIDPDWQKRQDGERRNKKDKNQHGEKESLKTEAITASRLKELAFEKMKKDPLLEILNKLPNKNGQRWIVFPFDFVQDGREYRVSMRILLDDKHLRAACMALDIAESNAFDRRWLFVMESVNEKPVKLSVFLMPGSNQSESMIKNYNLLKPRLSELLEIPPERISVKISEESFPHEAGTELFSLVDEAV